MSLTGAYEKDGERVVGGSVREDGSVRPIAKVRPGYLAKEDTPKYKPRGARERDAKLGIAESTVPKVSEGTDDKKSAIKARIQAAKLEFERKKAEKAAEKEDAEVNEMTTQFVNMIVHRDELPPPRKRTEEDDKVWNGFVQEFEANKAKEKAELEKQKANKTVESKANPGKPKQESKKEVNKDVQKLSEDTQKPSKDTPVPRKALKSRHAKAAEDTDKPASAKTGYIPPHKRK